MMTVTNSITTDFITTYQQRVNDQLKLLLSSNSPVSDLLQQAMRYCVLGSGKRFRPLLVYAVGIGMDTSYQSCDMAAMAVELLHCFSLAHDDLPAMDDDDLRRGLPTCHKKFDEATAILAGDALMARAFHLLASCNLPQTMRLHMLDVLTQAIGDEGMVAGQMLDLAGEQQTLSLQQLNRVHQHKTGKLIEASLQLGAIAAGCEDRHILTQLEMLGSHIGLAFQIQDDLLDIEGTSTQIGKRTGADQAHQKATYPAIIGVKQAKVQLQNCYDQAHQLLTQFDFDTRYVQLLLTHMHSRNC